MTGAKGCANIVQLVSSKLCQLGIHSNSWSGTFALSAPLVFVGQLSDAESLAPRINNKECEAEAQANLGQQQIKALGTWSGVTHTASPSWPTVKRLHSVLEETSECFSVVGVDVTACYVISYGTVVSSCSRTVMLVHSWLARACRMTLQVAASPAPYSAGSKADSRREFFISWCHLH